uniref:Uncharacterized protein n=1 Tax=Cyanothece sp. (strain PCC 7425 / ATCC 29141) TaxID=395961 RepID=B8HN11_CYAP4
MGMPSEEELRKSHLESIQKFRELTDGMLSLFSKIEPDPANPEELLDQVKSIDTLIKIHRKLDRMEREVKRPIR